jgi:dTDP-glucose 4,6-dehydratase
LVNVDLGTYAADKDRLEGRDVETLHIDIRDRHVAQVIETRKPAVIVHFAAETHVTRSETAEKDFFATNVGGTEVLLDAAKSAGVGAFIHISTDEVYGPALERPFKEEDKEEGEGKATSPYARSKAVADDLAASYAGNMRVVIVRPTNCFGSWQHPEKAIARWTTRALRGERIPVWGDGQQVRDWMFVDDLCSAIWSLVEKGETGGIYNVGPGNDAIANLDIARAIAKAAGRDADAVYLTKYDRPNHDRRYSVDAGRVRNLGWTPTTGLTEGIQRTVDWYRTHRAWWERLVPVAESLYDDDDESR